MLFVSACNSWQKWFNAVPPEKIARLCLWLSSFSSWIKFIICH